MGSVTGLEGDSMDTRRKDTWARVLCGPEQGTDAVIIILSLPRPTSDTCIASMTAQALFQILHLK